MTIICAECNKSIIGECFIAQRLKAKKDWILKLFPFIKVCENCFKTNHLGEYKKYLFDYEDCIRQQDEENKILIECIDFRLKNDSNLSKEDKNIIELIKSKMG